MGINPAWTVWSNLLIVVTGCIGIAVGLIMWASIDFINEENANGNFDRARNAGIYIAIFISAIITMGLMLCACSLNQPSMLQTFGCFSFIFSVVLLIVGGSQINQGNNSEKEQRWIGLWFMLGILLLVGSIVALKVSKTARYDPSYDEEHHEHFPEYYGPKHEGDKNEVKVIVVNPGEEANDIVSDIARQASHQSGHAPHHSHSEHSHSQHSHVQHYDV